MRDHLERLVFIDETALKTNMTKTSGWAMRGDRLLDERRRHVPQHRGAVRGRRFDQDGMPCAAGVHKRPHKGWRRTRLRTP